MAPVPIVDPLGAELGVPVVARNPAMRWHTLSMLGPRYSLPGAGRRLCNWPALVAA
jgi:maleate cis-trans isomerase